MHKKIKWLDIICRYFICLLMLIYGIVKVFHGQFYTDNYWKDMPLSQLSGMELVWSFYSYSPVYETILGLIEVSVGLLVFFKTTTKLGVLFFLPVITNLVLINIIYSIGALPAAFPLFGAGVILFFIHLKSYKAYFFDGENTNTPKNNSFKTIAPKAFVIILGCSLSSMAIYNNKFRIKQDNEIKGAWILNGHPEIKRIYFEKGNTCVIKDAKDSLYFGSYQTNSNKTITVTELNNPLVDWKALPYSIENDTLFVGNTSIKLVLSKVN